MNFLTTTGITARYIHTTREFVLETSDTCYLQVMATPRLLEQNPHLKPHVTTNQVGDDIVILNISPRACRDFAVKDTAITFKARYRGEEYDHDIKLHEMLGLYSPDFPQVIHTCIPTTILNTGTSMQLVHGIITDMMTVTESPADTEVKEPTRAPFLKVVK